MGSPVHVVAAVLRSAEGHVLIQERPPGKDMSGYWEFPGGKVQPGEAAWDALARELHEELGVTARAGQPLITLHHTYEERSVRLEMWDVEHWRGVAHPRENQTLSWCAVADLDAVRLLPADGPVITALRLPHVHLVTPDLCGSAADFLKTLTATVAAHRLSMVTLRQTVCSDTQYYGLARAVVQALAPLGCDVLLHGNPAERVTWVEEIGAGGFHLCASDPVDTASLERNGHWLAMSCHTLEQLHRAADAHVDFGLLGPLVSTVSHSGVQPLGWEQFNDLVSEMNFPVYAQGGLRPCDGDRSRAAGAQGISALRGLWGTVPEG
ncbi:MAG: Nudix family hydrolase [Gammaproteobacteria bacterium]|nr:Nudix family hydrolase [Gammaproteobacteria bacterium]